VFQTKQVSKISLNQLNIEHIYRKYTGREVSPAEARLLFRESGNTSNGFSYFWRNSEDRLSYPALQNIQESSVVVFRRSNHVGTLRILQKLVVDSEEVGYGDKELYWLASTIANEPFSFEPYLGGIYGDCGPVLHYDPNDAQLTSTSLTVASVLFLNAEYLLDKCTYVGEGLETVISNPVPATASTEFFDMNPLNVTTGGRCGACKHMGCVPVPDYINRAIVEVQQAIIHERRTSKKNNEYLVLPNEG